MDIVSIVVGTIEVIAAVAVIAFGVDVVAGFFGAKKKAEEPEQAEQPVVVPLPPVEKEPEEEPHLPAFVDHINAIEADEMLSDEVALAFVIEEDEDEPEEDGVVLPKAEDGPKTEGKRGFINIGDIDVAFEAHDHITLDVLKHKGLVPDKIKRIKILADGELTKPLTVKAHSFSIQAIKMIELTGGTVIRIR